MLNVIKKSKLTITINPIIIEVFLPILSKNIPTTGDKAKPAISNALNLLMLIYQNYY